MNDRVMNDLYDRLRPEDEPLGADTADRVWARVSGESLAGEAPASDEHRERNVDRSPGAVPSLRVERTRRRTARPISRRVGVWAASAAAISGLAATAAVVGSRDTVVAPADSLPTATPTPESPQPYPSSPIDPTTEPGEQQPAVSGPETAGDSMSVGTKFAVADFVPTGWKIDSMNASPTGSIFGGESWALLDVEGNVSGVVSIRAPRPIDEEEAAARANDDDRNTTVRGLPAIEYEQSKQGGNDVPRSGISWVENSLAIDVTATEDARSLVRPAAEVLTIDASTQSLSLPDELGLVAADELGFVEPTAVHTVITMSPSEGSSGVLVAVRANTYGYDLDRLVGPDFVWDPVRIDGLEAIVTTTPGGGRWVAWVDDGMHILVQADIVISDDELFEIVRSIRLTDGDEFVEVGEAIAGEGNAEIASWDVFDRTATPDGLGITIRSRPGSGGASAICVEAPHPDCTTIISEGGGIEGFEENGAVAFDVDGRTVGIAWVSDDLVIDSIDWILAPADLDDVVLRPSEVLNPGDGFVDGTTATVLVNERADQGRFVVVEIPDGERPPTIRFVADGVDPDIADIQERFELTPTMDDPFGF